MGRIIELDAATANGIAAGEVVERPSSVVKELIENSIDAGASVITVEIEGGGITMIRITDDGCGMDESDAKLAFLCHATSKLKSLDDLFSLNTMGFRGEALSSISAASRVNIKTRQPGADTGTEVTVEAGKMLKVSPAGGPSGTRIEVRDLFYNFPARYKFLKKDQTEAQYITTICERFALIRPDISFRLISQGKELLHTPGNNDSISALYSIYGKQIVDQSIPVSDTFGELKIEGFAGKPEIAKGSRADQVIFVNDRIIRSKVISSAIDEAYKTMLMKGRYAFLILNIKVPSQLIDVNVHPQKAEVRFWNDSEVFRAVFHVLQNALLSVSHVIEPHMLFPENEKNKNSNNNNASSSNANNGNVDTNSEDPNIAPGQTKKASYSYPKQHGIDYLNDYVSHYQKDAGTNNPGDNAISLLNRNDVQTDISKSNDVLRDEKNENERNEGSSALGFSINDLLEARIIGVAFATYILLEVGKNLILLDQHAAHEKILFEKLLKEKKQNESKSIRSQVLLVPVIMTLPPADMLFLDEVHTIMQNAGFVFESMGGREVILREVADVSQSFLPESAFRNALDSLKTEIPKTDEALLLLLATSACKAAVKGHDRLDDLEIRQLINDLSGLNNPYHCPHGRPIIIKISQKDLEKEFKRIV